MDACTYINDLSPYLDGELEARRRTALEAHLSGCAACRAELGQLRALSGLLVDLVDAPQPSLPAQAMGRLHGSVNHWLQEAAQVEREAERAERRILRISRILTGIAACVLLAGSLWLVRSRQAVSPPHPSVLINNRPVESAEGSGLAVSVLGPTEEMASTSDGSADLLVGGLVNPAGGPGESAPAGNEGAE